jgi:hypothetical protein
LVTENAHSTLKGCRTTRPTRPSLGANLHWSLDACNRTFLHPRVRSVVFSFTFAVQANDTDSQVLIRVGPHVRDGSSSVSGRSFSCELKTGENPRHGERTAVVKKKIPNQPIRSHFSFPCSSRFPWVAATTAWLERMGEEEGGKGLEG